MIDRSRTERGRLTIRILGAAAVAIWSMAVVLVVRSVLTPPDATVKPLVELAEGGGTLEEEADSLRDGTRTFLQRRDPRDEIWRDVDFLDPANDSDGASRIMKGVLIPWSPSIGNAQDEYSPPFRVR